MSRVSCGAWILEDMTHVAVIIRLYDPSHCRVTLVNCITCKENRFMKSINLSECCSLDRLGPEWELGVSSHEFSDRAAGAWNLQEVPRSLAFLGVEM